MAVFVTWPQALVPASRFVAHVDSYFSTWRIMWIAHALATDPARLFDANIFHPSTGTLAFSDATLLQGALAAPLLWAGLPPVLGYNLLLLAGFAASGLGMFVLARHVTGSAVPAMVAAAVFTMAPYRIEHVMHLEMQWAMWIPLTLWALTRTVEEGSWRMAGASGVFLALQALSCVYYGVFLAATVLLFVPLLLLRRRSGLREVVGPLALAAAVAAALTTPYVVPYAASARTVGERPASEVTTLSATPTDYLATTSLNRVWGRTTARWGSNERRLFPGAAAILLALVACLGGARRDAWIYLATALFAAEMSLGLNGPVYAFLFEHLEPLRGLRSPARFAIVTQCAIAVLAGLGVRDLQRRLSAGGWRAGRWVGVAAVMVVAVESANHPMVLEAARPPSVAARDVYRAIQSEAAGAVLELPVPDLSALPGNEALYAFWSAGRWHRLVNGYSGYYPQVYAETLNVMRNFPDEESVARLQRMGVRHVVVHRELLPPDRYTALLLAMSADERLEVVGQFPAPGGEASLYRLAPGR